jgi:hypothetical protein
MGTPRLVLSAVTLMTLCFSFADIAPAEKATAYSKEVMEQPLATKQHYDLYGIHFDFDKAMIQPDSNALLDDIASTLKQFPKWRVRITGHTDSTGDAAYNLTMDPYEKYDMTFNGAAPARVLTTSPGRYAGQDNGWVLALIEPVILDFDKRS